MNKKKQTFSPLRVIKVLALFFIVGILIVPLIVGIVNKNNYPEQYNKEVSEYEKEIKEIEECLEKARELAEEAKPTQLLPFDEPLKKTDVKEETDLWKYDPQELNKIKPMAKTIAWRPMSRDCYMRKASMIEPRKNPPSIFYYYGTIEFISLILILITLFEVAKLKNKNNTH